MSVDIEKELIDYYHNYCELTIWFKKILLHANPKNFITIADITKDFITERNTILQYVKAERRRVVRTELNRIATSYYAKVSHWSMKQKITVDMV